uniref:Uncharacterized protein n=1 Tax=Cacopsylla melanoneura TaxID=428564 RepID=A0A8D9ERZ2_9HEMI
MQHMQHVKSSPRTLFLIQLNQENVWQSFYQLCPPYVYVYLVKVMPTFIRGHVAFIRTPQLPANHHFVSLQVKSYGQIRTRLSCPLPMFLGENKHLSVRNQKTKFLLKRNPNTPEPNFYEMFTEIIVPKVTVNISLEERIIVDSWKYRKEYQTASRSETQQHAKKRKPNEPENKEKPTVKHLIAKIKEVKNQLNHVKNMGSSSGNHNTPDSQYSQSVSPLIIRKLKTVSSDLTADTSSESDGPNMNSVKHKQAGKSNTNAQSSGAKEGHTSKKSAPSKQISKNKKTSNMPENMSAAKSSSSKCYDSYSPPAQKLLLKLADALETVKSHLKSPNRTQTPESEMKLAQAFRTIQCNRSHVSYVQKMSNQLPVTNHRTLLTSSKDPDPRPRAHTLASSKDPNPRPTAHTLSPSIQVPSPIKRPRGRPRKDQKTLVSSTCTQSCVTPEFTVHD